MQLHSSPLTNHSELHELPRLVRALLVCNCGLAGRRRCRSPSVATEMSSVTVPERVCDTLAVRVCMWKAVG